MKILHLVHAYSPAIGGSEYLMQQVSEYLAGSGEDVTVFTTFAYNSGLFTRPGGVAMPMSRGDEVINGVRVRRFPVVNRWGRYLYVLQYGFYRLRLPGNGFLRMLYYGPISPTMKHAVRDVDADIIVSAPFPLNHMAYGFGHRRRVPVVLVGCMHTVDRHGFHNPRIRNMIRDAAGYVALTPHERDFLVNRWGISPDRVEVIGVGIDVNRPRVGENRVRAELGIGPDEPLIGFVGQHGLHKGIDTLIAAMPRVWSGHPGARLLIAGGTTPFTADFKARAREVDEQGDRIYFMDNVDEARKYEILETVDIFASPSGFESFGITVLEAWQCGKPVVACNIEATRNLVSHGETGFLVDYKNIDQLAGVLTELLGDPGLCRRIGDRGYEFLCRRYSKEIIGEQYRDFYRRLI